MSLTLLPNELIEIIGSFIEVDDLLSLCSMSLKFTDLCHDSQFWRNQILFYHPMKLDNLSLDELITLYRKVRQSGYLYIFGISMDGALGLGNVSLQPYPTKVFARGDIFQISCGYYHNALVTTDGDIYVFGYNYNYQLGLGDTDERTIPTSISDFSNVIQVSCGFGSTAFITTIGQLYTFGHNNYGQLGVDNCRYLTRPFLFNQLIDKKIVQVSCGSHHIGIVTDRGEAYVWGSGDNGELGRGPIHTKNTAIPILVNINHRIKQLVCGHDLTGLLTEQGDVYMCGKGNFGQLGIEDIDHSWWPRKVHNLPSIHQISLGMNHSLFLTKTGEVYGCGNNRSLQLGVVGDKIYHPVKINYLPPIRQVAGGSTHSVFLTTKGDVYICGDNRKGILGFDPQDTYIPVPRQIPQISKVRQISAGTDLTALII